MSSHAIYQYKPQLEATGFPADKDGGALHPMRSFEYRLPRQPISLRVDLVLKDRTLSGTCSDISEDGVRATFDDAVETGLAGSLILPLPRWKTTLAVIVSRVEHDHVVLSFSRDSTDDVVRIQRILALICEGTGS